MKMRFTQVTTAMVAALLSVQQIALAQSPNPQAISLYNLGLTAYKQSSPESAVIFFRRATDIDPDLADAQYNLGIIYQSERRYKEAIPRFEEVLRIKPTDPDAHYQLALMLQEMGRLQEARQHLADVPPSYAKFADAQNRIAALNNQLAASPTTPGEAAQPITSNQYTAPASQPNSSAYSFGTAPGSNSLPIANSQQNNSIVTTTEVPTSVVQTTVAAPTTAAPAVVSKPVATLANSSLRLIATGFSAPSGLAFDKLGNLYVANYLNSTIDRISSDGQKSRFSSGANIKGPIGLVIDANGYVYVANYNGGSVARISPAGVATIIATGLRKPYYLALDHDGNLYISQQEDNSIVSISLPKSIGSRLSNRPILPR